MNVLRALLCFFSYLPPLFMTILMQLIWSHDPVAIPYKYSSLFLNSLVYIYDGTLWW